MHLFSHDFLHLLRYTFSRFRVITAWRLSPDRTIPRPPPPLIRGQGKETENRFNIHINLPEPVFRPLKVSLLRFLGPVHTCGWAHYSNSA